MPWPWDDDQEAAAAVAQRRFDPEALTPEIRSLMTRPYLPQPDEINAAQERQQEDASKGILSTILSLPEIALFGQSVKGAVKGGAQEGFGGAVMGFLRGTPIAYLGEAITGADLYDDTRFTDIRRAFGQTDVTEGASNHVINFLGEVALSPLELFANPFGITTKGAKMAKWSTAALGEAVALGNRAALVLKIPFGPVIAETNLGFKSGSVLLGSFLDSIGSVIRTNPVTKPLVGMFSHKAGIADPKQAAFMSAAIDSGTATRNAVGQTALKEFYETVTPAGQKLAQNQGYAGALDVMHRAGLGALDEAQSLEGIAAVFTNPDVAFRTARRNALIANDPEFAKLWEKAFVEGDQAAIKTIYDTHPTLPLPKELLEKAGLKARVGSEISWIDDLSQSEKLVEAAGIDATSMGMAARADVSIADRSVGALAAAKRGRDAAWEQWKSLKSAMNSGEFSKADLDSYLRWHKQTMVTRGQAEIAVGALNETLEPFLGIYAPSIVNPAMASLINERALDVMRQYQYNLPRSLLDMTAMEANAVARDFGLKATGFIPTKELEKGGAEAVWKRIFDTKFIRRLHKTDPKAAELFGSLTEASDFFRISPVQNAIERVERGAEKMFLKGLQDGAISEGSPLVHEVMTVRDLIDGTPAAQAALSPGSEYRLVVKGRGGIKAPTRAEIKSKYQLDPEHAAASQIANHQIRDEFHRRLATGAANHERLLDELDFARQLHVDSVPDELIAKEGELLASSRVKAAVRNVHESNRLLTDALALRRFHVERGRAGIQQKLTSADPAIQEAYQNARAAFGPMAEGRRGDKAFRAHLREQVRIAQERVKFANGHLDAMRDAVDNMVEDFHATLDEWTAGYQKQKNILRLDRREAVDLLKKDEGARLGLVQRMKERGIDPRHLTNEMQLRDKYAAHGATALDEAKLIQVGDKGQTLYDRIVSRADPGTKVFKVRREDWKAFTDQMDDLVKPDPARINGVARALDHVKRAWSIHTAMNPVFMSTRVRNAVQNVFAATNAGLFSPKAQVEAGKVSNAFRKMLKGDASAWKLLDPELRASADDAIRRGVIQLSPVYAGEVGLNAEQWINRTASPSMKRMAADLPGLVIPEVYKKNPADNVFVKWASNLESNLDNWQRFAAYRGGLKKGLSPEDAAGAVRRAMYDSKAPMTWTERTILRRFIPFYSFQKYAFQNVASTFLSRPGALTWAEKYRQVAAESPLQGGPAVSPDDATFLPPFIKDQFGIVSRNTPQGPVYRLFGSYMPLGEIAALANGLDDAFGANEAAPTGQGLIRYAVSKMHPVLKQTAQQIWNRDFYSDRPLEDFPGEQGEMYGVVMPKRTISMLRNIRFLNELDKLNVFNASEARAMVDAVVREQNQDRPQQDIVARFMQSAFNPLPAPQERVIDPVRESRYRQMKDEEQRRRDKGRVLRLIAAPDSLPAKETNLIKLREDYAETTARMRRRAAATAPYLANSPNRAREPRINLLR